MSLKYNTIQLFSTLWLALGTIVFLLGFCKIYYALPVVCGMIWIIAKQYKNNTDRKDLKLSYKHIGFVIFIAFCSTYCAELVVMWYNLMTISDAMPYLVIL